MVDTAAAADLSQTFNEEDPVDPLAATPAEIPGISAAVSPPPTKTKPSKRELREIGSPPPPPDPLSAGGFIASPTYYADMLKAGQQQMAEVEFVCLSI